MNLQPLDNSATIYHIRVFFEGDTLVTATAKTTLNGTEHTVCTTVQYGYKLVGNSTILTVEPQSTTVTQPTKTPEQLQQEAEQNGWIRPENEFLCSIHGIGYI